MTTFNSPRGFTLIELIFAMSLLGILVAIGLPAYSGYLQRAQLSEVMLGFDGMATAARVEAAENERSLCNWPGSSTGPDAATRRIQQIVDRDLALLDPAYWSRSASGLDTLKPGSNSALVIQYAGVGEQGVRRAEALATMFMDNGLFHQWNQRTTSYAAFSVLLDHCQSTPAGTAVVSGVTALNFDHGQHSTPPGTKPPAPATIDPATSVPPAKVDSTGSGNSNGGGAPSLPASSTPSTTGDPAKPAVTAQQAPVPVQSVMNPAQQAAQCRANCRRIWPHGNSIMYRNCKAACNH